MSESELTAGSVVGSCTLLRLLGEGGMGEIWEAEQREPIRRRVALKFLKAGFDTKDFLARFEAERQALAFMDHPNIASVFEAGVTHGGRPYYVMELVTGLPITDFCDDRRLTTRDRLELFGMVCRAVQHAHQKAIIHRDLKPSNVLVTMQDDKPVAKVIDFGIAKALTGTLTNRTLVTDLGRPIGTPGYMSPEQWEAGQTDIDTRSDIYSLGVMLYELLVGKLPVDAAQIRRAGAGASFLLRESQPPSPSTRVRSLGSDTPWVVKARGTDPRSLERELKGDLDWITLKALEHDRSRRYETAHALLQDITRHLKSEPVQARPPSVAYRAGRFVRRHRFGVSAAAAALLAGIAFMMVTLTQSRRIAQERDRARVEANRASALNDFLQRTLLSPDPFDGFGRNTTMLEALDSASSRLARQPPPLPSVAASMGSAIGWAYFKLGAYDRAEPLLRRALATRQRYTPADSSSIAESLYRLAALQDIRARPDSAALLYSTALSLFRGKSDRNDAELADALIRSGTFFGNRGDTVKARRALEEARTIYGRSADSAGLATADNELGALEYASGNLDRAAMLFQRSLDYRRPHLGNHPLVAGTLSNLGAVLEDLHRPGEAESAYRDALRIGEQTLGPDHDQVTATMNNLGILLDQSGRPAEAEGFLRRAYLTDQRKLGPDHPALGADLLNLSRVLCRTGKAEEGEAMARRSARILARDAGPDSWPVAQARVTTGVCLTFLRRFAEAEAEILAGLRGIEAKLGRSHWRADTARVRLRTLYTAWGKPERAMQ